MQVERVVSQFLIHLNVERTLSKNTLAAYRRDLKYYVNYLKKVNITDLDAVDSNVVCGFVDYLHGSVSSAEQNVKENTESKVQTHLALSNASISRVLAAVRGLHKFALTENLAKTDPAYEVKPPKQIKRLPKAITVEEMQTLIEAANIGQSPVELRNRALCEILYGTGARISEAVNLSIENFDLEQGFIRLFGKGAKERIVPLGSYAIDAINAYLVRGRPTLAKKGTGNGMLFLNTRGKPLSRQSAWEAIQNIAQKAGLTGISPHTFRHSFATHLLQGGADIRTVQEMLGHASVTTTQIYTKVTPDTLREIYLTSHPRALNI